MVYAVVTDAAYGSAKAISTSVVTYAIAAQEILISLLERFVPVNNEVRPHVSLKGLTPFEVVGGLRPDNPDDLKSVNLISKKETEIMRDEVKCTECI